MKRKYLALGLSVVLVLGLVACGNQTQEPQEPKQEAQQVEPVKTEPTEPAEATPEVEPKEDLEKPALTEDDTATADEAGEAEPEPEVEPVVEAKPTTTPQQTTSPKSEGQQQQSSGQQQTQTQPDSSGWVDPMQQLKDLESQGFTSAGSNNNYTDEDRRILAQLLGGGEISDQSQSGEQQSDGEYSMDQGRTEAEAAEALRAMQEQLGMISSNNSGNLTDEERAALVGSLELAP